LKDITFTNNALYFYAKTFSNFTLGAVPISGDTLASSPSAVLTFDMENYEKICGIGVYSTVMTMAPLGANIVLKCGV